MNSKLAKKTSQCRSCGHDRKSHYIYSPVCDGATEFSDLMLPIESIPCNMHVLSSSVSMSIICACSEFSPMDNLEYLELKHKRNEERKDENR